MDLSIRGTRVEVPRVSDQGFGVSGRPLAGRAQHYVAPAVSGDCATSRRAPSADSGSPSVSEEGGVASVTVSEQSWCAEDVEGVGEGAEGVASWEEESDGSSDSLEGRYRATGIRRAMMTAFSQFGPYATLRQGTGGRPGTAPARLARRRRATLRQTQSFGATEPVETAHLTVLQEGPSPDAWETQRTERRPFEPTDIARLRLQPPALPAGTRPRLLRPIRQTHFSSRRLQYYRAASRAYHGTRREWRDTQQHATPTWTVRDRSGTSHVFFVPPSDAPLMQVDPGLATRRSLQRTAHLHRAHRAQLAGDTPYMWQDDQDLDPATATLDPATATLDAHDLAQDRVPRAFMSSIRAT